jgi:hypothetical protein
MFCPRCGQERLSEETSFCSRCGFLLTAVTALIETGEVVGTKPAQTDKPISPRSRGIRQGLFMFLLTFVIAPVVGLISQFGLGIEPWPVGVVVFGLGIGSLVRIAYAFMFETRTSLLPTPMPNLDPQNPLLSAARSNALPPQDFRSEFVGANSWSRRSTNDLGPPSVTDGTTRLLETNKQ